VFKEGRVTEILNLYVTLIEIVIISLLAVFYIVEYSNQLCAVGGSLPCRMGVVRLNLLGLYKLE